MKDRVVRGEESLQRSVVLPQEFYSRETVKVAKDLLGKILVRTLRKKILLEGRIVEVEAYRGRDDPASHAYGALTERNRVMFHRVGLAYVYFIYGNHYCLNATARSKSEEAGAVLLRAIEPLKGITHIFRNRNIKEERLARREGEARPPPQLTNGPGKLTQAMRVTGKLNGIDLTDRMSELHVRRNVESKSEAEIVSTQRVGINKGKDKPWRFYIKGNAFVSKP
nr:DNA-3-methyladenine glycosylase [Candidatus Njordarchaeum guaymaensis]